MDNTARTLSYIQAKPILKWAGGKTQMLNDLLPKVPSSYGRYIEPFFGGGALFFALRPENAIIADSNPELVNMYRQVANNLDDVIDYLKKYKNTSEMFYQVRALSGQNFLLRRLLLEQFISIGRALTVCIVSTARVNSMFHTESM